MKSALKQGFTLLELLALITVVAILAAMAIPAFNLIQDMGNQTSTASNCRQIIMAMKIFANDNNTRYPEAYTGDSQVRTSNDAFRVLFIKDIIQDERIFGAKASKFVANCNIGSAPNFEQAVATDENHWALTPGQTQDSSGIMPLVYENPAVPSWPPKWNCDAAGQRVPGRTWRGGKIVIGRNDNSVNVEQLAAKHGPAVGPKALAGGRDMFTMASEDQPLKVLNILTSGGASYAMPPNAADQKPGSLPASSQGTPAAPAPAAPVPAAPAPAAPAPAPGF
jgi:prepilin-type N-terminal cleavage/methylation domain-containing protein